MMHPYKEVRCRGGVHAPAAVFSLSHVPLPPGPLRSLSARRGPVVFIPARLGVLLVRQSHGTQFPRRAKASGGAVNYNKQQKDKNEISIKTNGRRHPYVLRIHVRAICGVSAGEWFWLGCILRAARASL